MRTLLAIVMTVGLILNSGSGFVTAAYAKASMGAMRTAHAHPAASHEKMHAHSQQAGHCHKSSSKSPANGCECCDKNAKCTHESCACFKCFSVLADVRPVSQTGVAVVAFLGPDAFDKPPRSVRQPPPPPPQS